MNFGFQIETFPDWEYLVISDLWKKKCADLRIKTSSLMLLTITPSRHLLCIPFPQHAAIENFESPYFRRSSKQMEHSSSSSFGCWLLSMINVESNNLSNKNRQGGEDDKRKWQIFLSQGFSRFLPWFLPVFKKAVLKLNYGSKANDFPCSVERCTRDCISAEYKLGTIGFYSGTNKKVYRHTDMC